MTYANAGASSIAAIRPYCIPRFQSRLPPFGGRPLEEAALERDFATGLTGFLEAGLVGPPALPEAPGLRAAMGLLAGLGLGPARLWSFAFFG
jgi:hypothetical protein